MHHYTQQHTICILLHLVKKFLFLIIVQSITYL